VAAAVLDARVLREDFPILRRGAGDPPLVYLDSAATSQKPQAVLDAMDRYYREANANVHRGVYALAAEATDRYESARVEVARLIGAAREGTVFAKNASEAINLVAYAWGLRNLRAGDVVLLTEMEHHSNIVPWQIVADLTGARVVLTPVTPEGELDLESLERMLRTEPVRMVGVVHVSNVLGTINPVGAIARLAHDAGALVLADASQSVPHMPVDLTDLGCDFLVFTGHKMLGPTGIGVLAARPETLDAMEPFLGGGEMISDVRADGSTWADLPWKFEAGTPPIAEAVGLGAAARYLRGVGLEAVRAHELALVTHALEALREIPGLVVHGPSDPTRRGAPVSFSLPDLHPHDIAQLVDRDGVCVRAGHHCAKPLMRALGVGATARLSGYVYNDAEDVDALVASLLRAREFMAVR